MMDTAREAEVFHLPPRTKNAAAINQLAKKVNPMNNSVFSNLLFMEIPEYPAIWSASVRFIAGQNCLITCPTCNNRMS